MFSKIYYINLDRRKDREENIKNELNKIRFNGPKERVSAVDGKNIDYDNLPNNLFTNDAINTATNKNNGLYTVMTKGAIGCALSHKLIYEKILYGNDDYALILEDDIWFANNFTTKLLAIIMDMPKFDVLFIGYHHTRNNDKKYMKVDTEIYGLFGYIINKKAAKKFIELFPLTYQIDSELYKTFKDLDVYALKDKLIYSQPSQVADKFGTDIQHREYFNNTCKNNYNYELCILILVLSLFIVYFIYKISKQ